MLKPTNPAAQKALAANTYKVSPHRNVKIRMKPKDDNDKTAIFEGLDDGIMAAGEIFIPRTSVKKLMTYFDRLKERLEATNHQETARTT